MNPNVDLRQLAVRREAGAPAAAPRRRHLVSRYLLPGAVLLGFAAVLGWAGRDSLLPAQPVTVVPVLTVRGEVQTEGTQLFQAAGWVEARPTPVLVTALAEGVVDKLLVVENQHVEAGAPVALLVKTDAELALKSAQADLKLRQAELAGARATLAAAQVNLKQPVQLQAALGEAEAALARAELELVGLPFQTPAAQVRLALAQLNYDARKKGFSTGGVSDVQLLQAQSEFVTAKAALDELQARGPLLKREVEGHQRKRDALARRLELKTDEVRVVAEAQAGVKAAAGRVAMAQVALAAAQLRCERMIVRAPMCGRVLALIAKPGARLMGQDPRAAYDASTVVSLYDPALLQVRADVRIEDVPRVQPGQRVKVETPVSPQAPLDGEVLFATSQADVQKNTLQVKVALKDPPPALRPDMLVKVKFLAPAAPKGKGPAAAVLRLLVPRQLVETGADGGRVWVADQAAGVARLRVVKLGAAAGDLVEVVEGLNPADRLIAGGRDGLRDGQRIIVTGEDTTGGVLRESGPRTKQAPQKPAEQPGHKVKH